MYKRRARVLFLSPGDAVPAFMAVSWAQTLGSAWLEPRAVGSLAPGGVERAQRVLAEQGGEFSAEAAVSLTPEWLGWADLLVTLGPPAMPSLPVMPATLRVKHWPLPGKPKTGEGEAALAADRAIAAELRRQVASMVGGMQMLARGDGPSGRPGRDD